MASASKTPNLNLPQWVGTEKPERTDFNAAFDAIDDHVAESSSKHIKESGSNPNGSYIKFDDGTLICYQNVLFTYSGFLETTGDSIVALWTFPHAYAAPPVVGANVVSTNYAPLFRASLAVIPTLSNSDIIASIPGYVFSSSHELRALVNAIGRWK